MRFGGRGFQDCDEWQHQHDTKGVSIDEVVLSNRGNKMNMSEGEGIMHNMQERNDMEYREKKDEEMMK